MSPVLVSFRCLLVCGFSWGFGCLATPPPEDRVAAYGHISAGEGPVTVAIPYYQGSPQLVAELSVKEGDRVTARQKLATTQSHALAEAEVAGAKAHLDAAEARLVLLKAGPKREEITAQEATVRGLEAEARAEKARKRPDSAAGKEEAAAREEALDWKLRAGQHQLAAMRETRPAEVTVAEAEIAAVQAEVRRAEALLSFTEIAAPADGQILRILSRPGEGAPGRGLLELADTRAMVIKAELSVADAARVKTGARVIMKSDAWAGEIGGTVAHIAQRVERSVLATPSTFGNVDRQIVEATITPETPALLEGRSGAEVTVLIATDRASP